MNCAISDSLSLSTFGSPDGSGEEGSITPQSPRLPGFALGLLAWRSTDTKEIQDGIDIAFATSWHFFHLIFSLLQEVIDSGKQASMASSLKIIQAASSVWAIVLILVLALFAIQLVSVRSSD